MASAFNPGPGSHFDMDQKPSAPTNMEQKPPAFSNKVYVYALINYPHSPYCFVN
jgi:hypothetical protein